MVATAKGVVGGSNRTMLVLKCAALLGACGPVGQGQDGATGAHSTAVVYGGDDRRDVFAHGDPELAELARRALVALVPRQILSVGSDAEVEVTAQLLGDAYQLCPGENFAEQPSAAVCSGVLIDTDLVVTAAHCLRDGFSESLDCARFTYVFNYYYAAEGQLAPLSSDDVYECSGIAATVSQSTENGGDETELVLIQLDREVDSGRTPLQVRGAPLPTGAPLAVLGFPSGLPLKIDTGARVMDAEVSPDHFSLDSDTFGSSSGSAVLDEADELAGVFLRGGQDFEASPDGCRVVRVVEDPSQVDQHEEAMYASRAVEALCEREQSNPETSTTVLADCPRVSLRAGDGPRPNRGGCSYATPGRGVAATPWWHLSGILGMVGLGVAVLLRRRSASE